MDDTSLKKADMGTADGSDHGDALANDSPTQPLCNHTGEVHAGKDGEHVVDGSKQSAIDQLLRTQARLAEQ
ncbi:MAG TPA: hypothetical protein VGP68_16480, partial [Gemmataceae bacterium]|nr:hypothetical protein [Gemmataceae bacterium]